MSAVALCARRLRIAVIWACLGVVFAVLLAATAPMLAGARSLTVLSGSMTPAIETGDVVVTEPISPLAARVGDVVTFLDPEGSGKLISHRVRSVRPAGAAVKFVTRGDANTTTERWNVPADGSIGKVLYRLPKVGYALAWTGSGPARIALVVVPALLLCGIGLARIWRPRGGEGVEA